MFRPGLSLAFGLLVAPVAFAQFDPPVNEPTSTEAQNALLEEQSGQRHDQSHAKLIKSAEVVGALGDTLFGEQVNFYTGATSFEHTDAVLPGVGPAMAIRRTLSVETDKVFPNKHLLGDWDLGLPYISGVFTTAQGWRVAVGSNGSLMRCSAPTTVDEARPSAFATDGVAFEPKDFWQGYSMSIPGGGTQQLLFRGESPVAIPSMGGPYRWVTKEFWHIGCGALTSGQGGDGFVALSPDGTKYYFEWMLSKPQKDMGKSGPPPQSGSPMPWVTTGRVELRIYATRVVDRFNNMVTYHWTPDGLQSIEATDGRRFDFDYQAPGGAIESVRWGSGPLAREVNYHYLNESLHEVVYPDQSKWVLNLANVYARHFWDCGANPPGVRPVVPPASPDDYLNWIFKCWDRNSPNYGYKRKLSGESASGTLTHPSGATGTFTFQVKRHVRASVVVDHKLDGTGNCFVDNHPGIPGMPDQTPDGEGEPWDFFCWTPLNFDVLAITRKEISGVGVSTPMVWKYFYDPYDVNGPHPPDDYAPHTRKVSVHEPGQVRREFTFGNRYNINDGHLLMVETYDGLDESASLVHGTVNTYVAKEDLIQAAYPFPDRVGTNPQWTTDNIWAEWLLPQIKEQTLQEGVTYTRETLDFDEFAHPERIERRSEIGGTLLSKRTDVTAYAHNTAKWVLGLQASETNVETGKVVSRTVYDPNTALPMQQFSFGMPTPSVSFDYHADGNLRTAWDGLLRPTTLNDYMRGVPQTIGFANGQSIQATVDGLGRIEDSTDVFDTVTDYTYDVMGRLTEVNYQADGALNWTPRRLGFSRVTPQFGIGSGGQMHWQQVSRAENNSMITTTHYDALWRPVLIISEGQGAAPGDPAATPSYVVKRYNERGLEVFTSYPVSSINTINDNLKGVYTEYDALGRVTFTRADAENDTQLTSETRYLTPGPRTQVINPRGEVTTTTYQVYDAPSYDSPILIQSPEGVTTTITRDIFGKPRTVTRSGPGG